MISSRSLRVAGLLLALVLPLGGVRPAFAAVAVVNGGYESGSVGWSGWSANAGRQSTRVHSGFAAAAIASNATLDQSLTLTAGQSYTFSAWGYQNGSQGHLTLLCGGSSLGTVTFGAAGAWSSGSLPYEAISGSCLAVTLRVSGDSTAGLNQVVYVDDVSVSGGAVVTASPVVPVPPADDNYYLYLFASQRSEITPVGATYCPLVATGTDRVFVHSFGNYDAGANGCLTCKTGLCTAGDFLYVVNPDPPVVTKSSVGLPSADRAILMLDPFPQLVFTRSLLSFRAQISGYMSASIVVGAMATFVAIAVVVLAVRALFDTFHFYKSAITEGAERGEDGGYDGLE